MSEQPSVAKPQAPAKAAPKPQAKKPAAKPQKQDVKKETDTALYVVDTTCAPNAPHNVREHEVQVGNGRIFTYKFKYGEATKMPSGHARRFLHIREFNIYEDAELTVLVPTTSKADTTKIGDNIKLETGQVVARLGELTTDALFARCCQYAGSENLGEDAEREDAINFLRDKYGIPVPGAVSEDDLELEMDADEMDGILD